MSTPNPDAIGTLRAVDSPYCMSCGSHSIMDPEKRRLLYGPGRQVPPHRSGGGQLIPSQVPGFATVVTTNLIKPQPSETYSASDARRPTVDEPAFACLGCARIKGWGAPKPGAVGMGLYCCGGSGEPVLCYMRRDYANPVLAQDSITKEK
jgi:hypothetical protein